MSNLIIDTPWKFSEEQLQTVRGKRYDIHAAIQLAEELEVKELLIEDMCISYNSPCANSLRSFLEHIKGVASADLKYPIILNEDGFIIDGKHRLAKAILKGHTTIKTKRFKKDPSACYTWE